MTFLTASGVPPLPRRPAEFRPYAAMGYPAAFQAFTPPPSAFAFLYPCARYFAA